MSDEHKPAHAADDHATARAHAPAEAGTMSTGAAIIGFIFCFIMGALVMWGWDKSAGHGGSLMADSAGAGWSDEASPIPVTGKDPMYGKRDALVTIVEFSDFQCPYCSRVEPTVDQIKKAYTPDQVRIVWKNNPLPFHNNAKPAAEAAAGVFALKGSEAFWKFHDKAFANQGSLSPENYEKWAVESGVDLNKFKAGMTNHTWADKVEKDLAVARQANVGGTPGFMINGVLVSGAQPFDKFKTVIDAELAKANAKVASGTKKDAVYVAMSTENKKATPPPAEEKPKEDPNAVTKIPVGTQPVLGNPNALVTLVIYSDFQCPFCGRVEPTLKSLRDKYGDKIRMVWKDAPLPFHNRAEPAAEMALEARAQKGDKGFWEAHDKLFDKQKDLSDEVLIGVATEMKLNVEKVKSAIANHTYKKDIDAQLEEGKTFGVQGTPNMFINGRHIVGAQPEENFTKIIDEEIKKAQDLIAKGTPPNKIYDAILAAAPTPAAPAPAAAPGEPEKKVLNNIPANDPAKGSNKAKVVIHEFSDFQCPFCSRVEPTIAQVMKDYGDKVKFVWHDMPLPFHKDAPLAAEAAREAFAQKGPDGFWKMHDKLFSNQAKIKREDLDGYAKEQGLNLDKFKVALDTESHKAEIEADNKVANDAHINGTPAFVVNGYFINGALPVEEFKKVIDRALAEAK